jgi:hypothetical protein
VPPPGRQSAPSPGDVADTAYHAGPGFGVGAQIGRYRIDRELARGGQGVVYAAWDLRFDRPVALKQLLTGRVSRSERKRFQREALATAKLQHPGIVRVHDFVEHAGTASLVLDLVEGRSLQQRLKDGGPLPVAEAIEVGIALADALAYAHERGVLHRDVKPHNVLLGRDGRPRLTDFGLAKVVGLAPASEDDEESSRSGAGAGGEGPFTAERSLTRSGQLLGTPAYMPPEQADGDLDAIGPPADVYALGASLFALLTGRPPFRAKTLMALVRAVCEEAPPRPSSLRADLDERVDEVLLRCLEKDPSHRYLDGASLAAALRGCLLEVIPQRSVRPQAQPTGVARSGIRALLPFAALVVVPFCVWAGAGVVWNAQKAAEERAAVTEADAKVAARREAQEAFEAVPMLLAMEDPFLHAPAEEAVAIHRRPGLHRAKEGLERPASVEDLARRIHQAWRRTRARPAGDLVRLEPPAGWQVEDPFALDLEAAAKSPSAVVPVEVGDGRLVWARVDDQTVRDLTHARLTAPADVPGSGSVWIRSCPLPEGLRGRDTSALARALGGWLEERECGRSTYLRTAGQAVVGEHRGVRLTAVGSKASFHLVAFRVKDRLLTVVVDGPKKLHEDSDGALALEQRVGVLLPALGPVLEELAR